VDDASGFPDSTSSASMIDMARFRFVPGGVEVGRGGADCDCCPQRSPIVGEDEGRADPPQDTRVW
jgi:hypothetical protein